MTSRTATLIGLSAILFCFACLYLSTSGPGPYSVDAKMGKS